MTRKKETDSNLVSKASVATIAGIVFTVLTILFGFLGWLGKSSFTPWLVDRVFGVSKYVLEEVTKRIDSGYADTFIFSLSAAETKSQLLFYAEKGQRVKLTINANSTGQRPTMFRVYIDGSPWESARQAPFHIVHGDITDKLRFDTEPGGDIHSLKFIPVDLKADAWIVIDALVLVYNN